MTSTNFAVKTSEGSLDCLLIEPDQLAPAPAMLFTFSSTAEDATNVAPHSLPAEAFLNKGHRVLSFDLPFHGKRIGPDGRQSLEGMRDSFLDGSDPFVQFIEDGKAALDECEARNLISAPGVSVCGVSRGGYCALRLAAADVRFHSVAGLAPVVDWRRLTGFEQVKDHPGFASLAMPSWSEPLVGRGVYVVIGNSDIRVGTDLSVASMLKLYELEAAENRTTSRLCLHVVDELPGHSILECWYSDAGNWLRRQCEALSAR